MHLMRLEVVPIGLSKVNRKIMVKNCAVAHGEMTTTIGYSVGRASTRHPFARDVIPIPMAGQNVRQEVLFHLWCGKSILIWFIVEFLDD